MAEHDGSELVRTWMHSRKGRITGVEVGGDDVWMHVRLVGDHRLRYGSKANRGRIDEDATIETFRRSFMQELGG